MALHATVVFAYACGAVALFHNAWADPTARVIGSCCDSAAYVDTFRFTGTALLHGQNPLFSTLMHAPQGFNVMWQPNVMPLVGLVVYPSENLVGPIASYDLVLTTALVSSGWACFVLARRLVGGFLGPFVGGLFFAFSPTMTSHSLGHPQVTVAGFAPLAVLLTVEILVAQHWRWWVAGPALGALAALQLLLGEELLALTVITCAVLGVVLAARFPREIASRLRHASAATAAAAATFAALAAAPLLEQLIGPERLLGPVRSTVLAGTNLGALVVPESFTTEFAPHFILSVDRLWFASSSVSETTAYLGVTLIAALAAFAATRRRVPLVQVAVVSVLAVAVLSLGEQLRVGSGRVDIWLPWRLVHTLPFVANVSPSRLFLMADLGVAVLIAAGVEWLCTWGTVRARCLGAVAVVLALAPLVPTFHYPEWTPQVPSFFTSRAVDAIPAGSTVLLVPIARGSPGDVSSEVWQAESGPRFAVVGGSVFVPGPSGQNSYPGGHETTLTHALDKLAAGDAPRHLLPLAPATIAEDRLQLAGFGARTVVLGPMADEGETLAFLESVIGRAPQHLAGVYVWLNASPVTGNGVRVPKHDDAARRSPAA